MGCDLSGQDCMANLVMIFALDFGLSFFFWGTFWFNNTLETQLEMMICKIREVFQIVLKYGSNLAQLLLISQMKDFIIIIMFCVSNDLCQSFLGAKKTLQE